MLIEERNQLVLENMGLVAQMADKYPSQYKDDLIQEGVLGLIKAADRFDASKNFKFATYASYWIRAYQSRFAKRERTMAAQIPVDMEGVKLDDQIQENFEDFIIAKDITDKVSKALAQEGITSEREIDIYLSRAISNSPETMRELGERYGVSKQRVQQLEARLKGKLDEIKKQLTRTNRKVNV